MNSKPELSSHQSVARLPEVGEGREGTAGSREVGEGEGVQVDIQRVRLIREAGRTARAASIAASARSHDRGRVAPGQAAIASSQASRGRHPAAESAERLLEVDRGEH
jgi:hypothetical protein